MNSRRLNSCCPYLRSPYSSIPVTVVSIPVVVLSSILAFSSYNPVVSSIYIVFSGIHIHSALYTAPFISSTSTAKRVFQSWGFRNWHNSHLTVSMSLCSVLWKLTLLSILAWHERTQFFLRHILGTINLHLSFKSLNNRFFLSLPMRSAFRVKNDNLVFATIVTLKIANGTEHSVSLRYPAVASFSGANRIREFWVEKFMPAFWVAERIEFFIYPGHHGWFVPVKMVTAL